MLRIFLKSAIYYTLARNYGKTMFFILGNVLFVILVNLVYADIVEYMSINAMKEDIIYVLVAKWALVFINISLVVYAVSLVLSTNKDMTKNKENEDLCEVQENTLQKKELKSHADLIIEELKAKGASLSQSKKEEDLREKSVLKSQSDVLIQGLKENK